MIKIKHNEHFTEYKTEPFDSLLYYAEKAGDKKGIKLLKKANLRIVKTLYWGV